MPLRNPLFTAFEVALQAAKEQDWEGPKTLEDINVRMMHANYATAMVPTRSDSENTSERNHLFNMSVRIRAKA
jgi:hypothetical protein